MKLSQKITEMEKSGKVYTADLYLIALEMADAVANLNRLAHILESGGPIVRAKTVASRIREAIDFGVKED